MFILKKDFDEEHPRDFPLIKFRFDEYKNYLHSVIEQFPESAREFALVEWRLDATDHRCPHDSWVEYLRIIEESAEKTRRQRTLHIELRLLGAYHDGFLDLNYVNVKKYSLNKNTSWNSHGDWLFDEVRLSDKNLVLHEVEFASGEYWLIECEDIKFEWKPFEQ
jgi:hypothetical protein